MSSKSAISAAIANGEAIDWEHASRTIEDAAERAIFENLRFLDELSRSTSGREIERRSERPALPVWVALAIGLSVSQTLVALVGRLLTGGTSPTAYAALASCVCLAIGLWLLLGGSEDPRARYFAGFLITSAAAAAHPDLRTQISGAASSIAIWALAPGISFAPAFLWFFVRRFPRLLRFGKFENTLSWGCRISVFVGWFLFVASVIGIWRAPDVAVRRYLGTFDESAWLGLFWVATFALALSAIVTAVARTPDAPPDEQRRLYFFVTALAVGLGPWCVDVLLQYLSPSYLQFVSRPDVFAWTTAALYLLLLSIPVTTTISIVAHRTLKVQFVLKRILGTVLHPSLLRGLLALVLLAFILQLYQQRTDSLLTILRDSATLILGFLVCLATVLLAFRRIALQIPDRLFPSKTEDWRQVLLQSSNRVRASRSLLDLERAVADAIRRALAADSVRLFVRTGTQFRPVENSGVSLEVGSAIVAVAESHPSSFVVAPEERDSLFPWLPETDKAWLVDEDAAVVVPVEGANNNDGALAALVTVGPRHGGSLYEKADLDFLTTIAGSIAASLENLNLRSVSEATTNIVIEREGVECLTCGLVSASPVARKCRCDGPLQDALLPQLIREKLLLRRVLGRGGMGVVYEAEDLDLGRTVAVKVMPRVDSETSFRLRKEARTMATVDHPHLARIHGLETWHGVPVLVMEYLAGGTLASRLGRVWPLDEAIALVKAIASAVASIHEKGWVHRDIKPSNIGFTGSEIPKLLDFGLARMTEETVESGFSDTLPAKHSGLDRATSALTYSSSSIAGTPRYLSPEAWEGRWGPRQDLWALALVLYELVAGRHPFDTHSLAQNPRTWYVPHIRQLRDDCPMALAGFLARALGQDEGLRFARTSEFILGLERASKN